MDRAEKQQLVTDIGTQIRESQITLCADYRGISVAQITELRRELRKIGATSKVVKNTLARLSVGKVLGDGSQDEVKKFLKIFEGPSFFIFCKSDPVAPAKVVSELIKKFKKCSMKGAWLEGRFLDAEGIETLSKMPGREELLAQLLSIINGPATKLLRLINTPATNVVNVVEAQRKKLEGAAQ